MRATTYPSPSADAALLSWNRWAPPPLPLAPTAALDRRTWARIIDGTIELTVAAVVVALMPHGRPLAADLVIIALVCSYETAAVAGAGATLGKRALGLRVVGLDQPDGRVPAAAAFRRGLVVSLTCCIGLGLLFVVAAIAIFALAVSVTMSPYRRGSHDRLAGTYVVGPNAPETIASSQFAGWVDPDHVSRPTPYGRLATLDERRRARAWRLDGDPVLVIVLVVVPLGLAAALQSGWAFLWAAIAWVVAFVIDETRRIARTGVTAGHKRYGLVVVDPRTGRPPSIGRSFWRAVVLALFLFIPILIPVLALCVKASPLARGPHDHAGGTIVVVHPATARGATTVPLVHPTAAVMAF